MSLVSLNLGTVGNVVDDGIQVRTHKDNFSPNSSSRLLPRLNYCNGRRVLYAFVRSNDDDDSEQPLCFDRTCTSTVPFYSRKMRTVPESILMDHVVDEISTTNKQYCTLVLSNCHFSVACFFSVRKRNFMRTRLVSTLQRRKHNTVLFQQL